MIVKYLFFYFTDYNKKAMHYFLLDSEVWEKILQAIHISSTG